MFFKSAKRVKELEKELKSAKSEVASLRNEVELLKIDAKKHEQVKNTSFITQHLTKIDSLEKELLKQKRRVEEAKIIAQEANEVKYDFLSNIRHEIRTPMNSILAFADMLKSEIKDKTQRSYATNIFDSGHKLLSLMDSIIELSHLESGAFTLDEKAVDVHSLFNSIVNEEKANAYKKGLELTLHIDETLPNSLIVDDLKIKEIVTNLIENAIKFTKSGYVKVFIGVASFDRVKNTLDFFVEVKDSGMGIEAKNHKKIFEIFEKRDNCNDIEFQGSGLGLSINRKMARLMNGEISVISELGSGATFTLMLKNIEIVLESAVDDAEEIVVDFSHISPDGANVMVIDESEKCREVILEAFRESNVEVFVFDNPRTAIESLNKTAYDLIFIDIDILSMDDNAVSKVIAKMSKAPVVTLTSVNVKSVALIDGGANIVGHLKKPLSEVALFKISLKILNGLYDVTTSKVTQGANDAFSKVSSANANNFLKEHNEKLTALYKDALATNDLAKIESFAKALGRLAKKHSIAPLEHYAEELLKKSSDFDIEAITSMMSEYKSKIKRVQSI